MTTSLYLMITETDDGTSVQHFTAETNRTDAYRAFCTKHWDEARHGPMPHDPLAAYDVVAETNNYVTLSEIDLSALPENAQLTSLLAEVIEFNPDSEGDVLLTLDSPTDVRARIHAALGKPWARHQLFQGYRNVERDSSDNPIVWQNKYHCVDCDESWTDDWSCQCDDKCPVCDTSISPFTSVWIGPEDPASQALWDHAKA